MNFDINKIKEILEVSKQSSNNIKNKLYVGCDIVEKIENDYIYLTCREKDFKVYIYNGTLLMMKRYIKGLTSNSVENKISSEITQKGEDMLSFMNERRVWNKIKDYNSLENIEDRKVIITKEIYDVN